MTSLTPLNSLFRQKLFRIPEYQRGYAWQKAQLKDFWEDLINLAADKNHYTGVITLEEVSKKTVKESDNEFWLIDDHSYVLYNVVDGQQRLTTIIIFLQALTERVLALEENQGKDSDQVFITDSLTVASITDAYLYKVKPGGLELRTYRFSYMEDGSSDDYLRHVILREENPGTIAETFYTLNLKNAKTYFTTQLQDLDLSQLQAVFKSLTKRFLFNEYVIRDEFNVHVAFETMNNRGKRLSDLELLKNRLIYLTTLFSETELPTAERRRLQEEINSAWKVVYHQLGRNPSRPLNDDEFLKAHWTMYFKYSRKTGQDYIRFLLDGEFSPHSVYEKVEKIAALEIPIEPKVDEINDVGDEPEDDAPAPLDVITTSRLQPRAIFDYVQSLKGSSIHWFSSYFPRQAGNLGDEEIEALEGLERIGMGYFRPLVMAILKNEQDGGARARIFRRIERFIFLAFRTGTFKANYRSSEFYNFARTLDRLEDPEEITSHLTLIDERLTTCLDWMFHKDGSFKIESFSTVIGKLVATGQGYYGWYGPLRYFLYEYELELLVASRQQKVNWNDLLKTGKDKISIEHIFPQTATDRYWKTHFAQVPESDWPKYNGSIGNLLLLATSINSSLQNDGFEAKRDPKFDSDGKKIRNGYADGSHSEIQVSRYAQWGPTEIRERGLKLLAFFERRWDVRFRDLTEKESLLFLPPPPTDEISTSDDMPTNLG